MIGSAAGMAIEHHPRLAIFAILLPVLLAALLAIFGPEAKGPEKRAAHDRANLECRLSNGTYEYFGTQGYACIPAPSSSSNRQ